jgi:hypothetical protein
MGAVVTRGENQEYDDELSIRGREKSAINKQKTPENSWGFLSCNGILNQSSR